MRIRSAVAAPLRAAAAWQVWLLAAALLTGCITKPPTDAEVAHVDRLLALIAERMELAGRLAQERWNARLGVDEPLRELESIDAAVARSLDFSLPPEIVRDVFQAQVDAAKIVQAALRQRWSAERRAPGAHAGDGGAGVWKEIARNTPALLEALARAYPALRKDGGRELLEKRMRTAFVSTPGGEPAAAAALDPLWQLAQ